MENTKVDEVHIGFSSGTNRDKEIKIVDYGFGTNYGISINEPDVLYITIDLTVEQLKNLKKQIKKALNEKRQVSTLSGMSEWNSEEEDKAWKYLRDDK